MGDVLTIKINVGQAEHALSILLRDGMDPDPIMDEVVTEQTSFLQIGASVQHAHAYERGFDEVCVCLKEQSGQTVQETKHVEQHEQRHKGHDFGCHKQLSQDAQLGDDEPNTCRNDLQQNHAPFRPCQEDNSDLLGGQSNRQIGSDFQTDEMLESLKTDLYALFDEGWKGLNRDFAIIPHLHPFAVIASQQMKMSWKCHNIFHVFTDGSCKRHDAAWAFVVLCECRTSARSEFFRIGYAAGKVDDSIGPVGMNAADAEATAIIAGVEYLLARPMIQNAEIFFHYDALGVGHGACGTQSIVQHVDPSSDRQRAARIMLSILQQRAGDVTGLHVKAHQGHPWNECADSIAGLVRQGWQPEVATEFRSGRLLANQLREWAWTEVWPDKQMPSLATVLDNQKADHNQGWYDPTLSIDTTGQERKTYEHDSKKKQSPEYGVYRLRFATANVETMDYNGDSECGSIKANELLRQCQQEQLHICAIQESRARYSRTITNGPFTRFVAKGCNGQAGVELWLNGEELAKIFHCAFQPEKDVCVWHSSERILAARCQLGTTVLEIVVFYAPQRGRAREEQDLWWQHFKSVLDKRDKRAHLFMLGDGNCSVGSCSGDEIGPLAADFEDEGGEYLREICVEQKLMIPSTFEGWHEGQTHTFLSANGSRSRIDYILMPQDLEMSVVRSYVHQDFDLMNGDRDHFPLCLECDIKVGAKEAIKRFTRSPLYHRAEASKTQQKHRLKEVLANCPSVDWAVDVNDHWSYLRHHLQSNVNYLFPCQKRQQRQLYFSEEAWNLLCYRKEIRKQYRALQREIRMLMLKAIWQVWKGTARDLEAEENFRMPFHFLRCQEAITFEARIKVDQGFKCIKRRDWKKWIQKQLNEKVANAQQVRSAELFKVLRPKQMIARSTGKLIRQLPGLRGGDGQWKSNRDEVALEWQTQFGTIENAEDVTVNDLLQRSVARCDGSWQAADLLSIPSLYQLESAIRALQATKATGLDGLGAEILQADPVVAAKQLFPLLLKAAVRGQGIMEFAGGWLLPLFKGKGSPQNMPGYRAILLESVVSRAFSKAWRPLITDGLGRVARPMQWGGRQGLSIEALHLHVHFWKRNAKKQGQSHAVIFLDIRAAFYSVVKQLVAGTASGMHSLDKVFEKMNLPIHMKEEFMQQTMGINLIKEATGSSIMANSIAAMLGQTWFVIPESKTLQAPMTGSRPGDPSADVLFSLVLAKVITVIEERAQQAGIQLSRQTNAGNVSQMVTWVDDIAFSITADADLLIRKTMDMLAIVQDAMLEHGLSLSYGVGKTAVLITFHGKGATTARQEAEQKYGHGLVLVSEHKGKVIIPMVGHYRHLGGFVTRSGSRLPELRVRTAGALSKLKPLKRLLVHQGLQKEQRSRLIKSLGLSVFTLHAGTLYALTQGEFQVWQAGVYKIYQSLLPRLATGEVQHCSMYQLADAMQSPMPMELMYLCRLRLLVHLFKTGDAHMIAAIVENF